MLNVTAAWLSPRHRMSLAGAGPCIDFVPGYSADLETGRHHVYNVTCAPALTLPRGLKV